MDSTEDTKKQTKKKGQHQRKRLSAAEVEAKKEPGLYPDGGGLYLRVSDTGTKSWVFRYMVNGRAKAMGLGRFGRRFPHKSLEDARDAAEEINDEIEDGRDLAREHLRRAMREATKEATKEGFRPEDFRKHVDNARKAALAACQTILEGSDPLEAKKALKRQRALQAHRNITFRDCAEKYIEEKERDGIWKNAKHAAQWKSTLETFTYDVIGKLPVRDIDRNHVLEVFERKSDKYPQGIWRDIPETASRVRNRIELILDWAKSRDFRDGENPARLKGNLGERLPKTSDLMKAGRAKARKHFASLPFAEMPKFMRELRAQQGEGAAALEFAILTAARSGEVRGACWEEINLETKTWTLPAARMKAGREHRIPLCSRALEILESVRGKKNKGLVFHGRTADKPLSDMSLTAVLRRMNRSVTAHGFRSTFRVWTTRLSVPDKVAEAAMAHVNKDKVEAAYLRTDFFEERIKIMDSWAAYCSQDPAKINVVVGINSAREAATV